MTERTCGACGKPLTQKPNETRWNWEKRRTCGHGTPCPTALRTSAPGYSEKIRDAKLRAFEANPASRERVARQAAKNALSNRKPPEVYGEMQRQFAASLTPEQRSQHYARKRNMAGLMGEEITRYRALCRKEVPAAQARAMILEERRVEVGRVARAMVEKHERELRDRY